MAHRIGRRPFQRRPPISIARSKDRTAKAEEAYWNLYADPWDARHKLEIFRERYNQARPHWALAATAPARVLTPHEVYVNGYEVNPPKWPRWVGWLEKDQENAAQPPNKTTPRISA